MLKPTDARSATNAFTLIELLVVVSIIALLISILLPSLNRAREQAKTTHCLARMKDFATGLAAYEGLNQGLMPPAEWSYLSDDNDPPEWTVRYGWAEVLFKEVYNEQPIPIEGFNGCPYRCNFPAQRSVEPKRYDEYFICRAVGDSSPSSGHYRVYLPFYAGGRITVDDDGRYVSGPSPHASGNRSALNPKKPILGDANPDSERGDGDVDESAATEGDDCSYIDAGEANIAGTNGYDGNRFDDRHSGGCNFLFGDFHAEWERNLRRELALDWDLNDIYDVE
jgi:prepilin-type N-terminal cleavage/methylation domain-containing protein/prepilin-type processing-associated H-X9-DG protein